MDLLSLSCSSSVPSTDLGSLRWKTRTCRSIVVHNKTGILSGYSNSPKRNRKASLQTTTISCSYAPDAEIDLAGVREKVGAGPLPKVLVPSLPDDSPGSSNRGSPISGGVWEWKPKLTVYYEMSGEENTTAPAVLFLPGFGVGSFHYEKQLKDLGREYRVYALDFLGQGKSLPTEDPTQVSKEAGEGSGEERSVWGFGDEPEPWAEELVYSMDLWKDQVHNFIQQVIGERVYVVGNSLGGFVAMYFAAYNPELVKGITLLNATPFWGLLPNPVTSPGLAKLFPWSGTFPLPPRVKRLTEFVWQKISAPESIHEILKQVYADHSTKVDKVFLRIIEVTQHPAAPASFASIMFAPRAQLSFREALTRCKLHNVPLCLVYGKEDPWVQPIWALKIKQQVPSAPFYEISPAGHCPHDEVPEVVNFLLRGWIKNVESQGSSPLPLLEELSSADYSVPRQVQFLKEGSKKEVDVNVFGSNFSFWSQLRSSVKSQLINLASMSRKAA